MYCFLSHSRLRLSACSPAHAGDHHREHPMPAVDSGFVISLRPGEQIRVDCSFSADWETCVQIYDQKSGQLLQVWNNYDGGGGSWLSPKNDTDQTRVLLLAGRHKRGRPDGQLPWIVSKVALLDQTEATRTIGWDDADNRTFNSSQVFVKWVK